MATAALLTQVSMRPNAATAAAAIDSTSCGFDTSAATWIARPPACLISLTASRRSPSLRAASATARASLRGTAVTSPIPLDAPVMTTTWSRRVSARHSCHRLHDAV